MSCSCGNPVEGAGPLCRRCEALRVLDLPPGASEKEIRAGYRTMVKVWHPDRFPGDEPLQKTAEARLKEINAAFQLLRTLPAPKRPAEPSTPQPQASARTAEPARTAANSGPQPSQGPQAGQAPHPGQGPRPGPRKYSPPAGYARRPASHSRAIFFWIAFLLGLIAMRYLWAAIRPTDTAGEQAQRIYGRDRLRPVTPAQRALAAFRSDLQRLGLGAADSAPDPEAQSDPRGQRMQPGPRPSRHAPELSRSYPYITVGTSRDEVLDDLGEPTAESENRLIYGRSELFFRGDNVVGWRIDPVSSPIRVKLWPASAVDPSVNSFGIGATKDTVLAVQGTPTALTENRFEYGRSQVYFSEDRVIGWKNELTSVPLRLAQP